MPRPRKKSPEGKVNVNGWVVSYADMVTILLAMFIALSALSQDQTGLTFVHGTGSFRDRIMSFGIPGLLPNSSQVVIHQTAGPTFASEDTEQGDTQEKDRLLDDEQERLQRFLHQLRSRLLVDRLAPTSSPTSIDFYERLGDQPPYLKPGHQEKLAPLLSLASRPGSRLQVVVWATAPAPQPCINATLRAAQLLQEIIALGGYDTATQKQLVAVGHPWLYPNVPRPVFSLIITRQQ